MELDFQFYRELNFWIFRKLDFSFLETDLYFTRAEYEKVNAWRRYWKEAVLWSHSAGFCSVLPQKLSCNWWDHVGAVAIHAIHKFLPLFVHWMFSSEPPPPPPITFTCTRMAISYYLSGSMGRQNDGNPVPWLATWAVKMELTCSLGIAYYPCTIIHSKSIKLSLVTLNLFLLGIFMDLAFALVHKKSKKRTRSISRHFDWTSKPWPITQVRIHIGVHWFARLRPRRMELANILPECLRNPGKVTSGS